MTTDDALDLLRRHQPMPDDEVLTEELIQRYDEVRKHFIESPDQRCIPLFLGSFGEGDGLGVYQLVEDVLIQYPPHQVIPHLETALSSSHRSIRYWAAEISANFPSQQLLHALSALLDEHDEDLVSASVIALGQLESPEARSALRSALGKAPSEHVRGFIEEQLAT